MRYITHKQNGSTFEASTIEGALCHAHLMIYMGQKTIDEARKTLKLGKPFTIIYGFKQVTITPTGTQ